MITIILKSSMLIKWIIVFNFFSACMILRSTSAFYACMSSRPASGHAGCACQLQHHRKRAEAFLQQAARGERPLGESESWHGPSVLVVWDQECVSNTSDAAVPQA